MEAAQVDAHDDDVRDAARRTPRRRRNERGASLVEYALMISLIAVACIVALSAFGVTNGGSINNSANEIVTAGGG